MRSVWADFNSMIEEDVVALNTVGSLEALNGFTTPPVEGERVLLSDDEIYVEGNLMQRGFAIGMLWCAKIDWKTQRDS